MKSDTEFQYMKVDEDTNTLVKGGEGEQGTNQTTQSPCDFLPPSANRTQEHPRTQPEIHFISPYS